MRSSLVLGCVLGTSALFAAPDVSVAAKDMGGPAVEDNVVANYSGLPKLTWEAAGTALTVQRAKTGTEQWKDIATVDAGESTFVDETAKVSVSYKYRLADDGGAGAASDDFTVMRYLPAKNADSIFSDGEGGQNWAWGGKAAVLAFDGGLNQQNYLDPGRYPDYSNPYTPVMGIDFGVGAVVYVNYCRAVPRYAAGQNCEHRLNGLTVYGAGAEWSTTGVKLSESISGVADGSGFAWYGLNVDATTGYRCIYVTGFSHGNATEVEFWGWTQEDVDNADFVSLEFTVARQDLEHSYAVLTADAKLAGVAVERARANSEDWAKVGEIGADGTFVDAACDGYGLFAYRLTNDEGSSAAQTFARVRKLSTTDATFHTDADMKEDWCKDPSFAFDGHTSTFPDIDKSRPKVIVDFGRPDDYVAVVRLYPRSELVGRFGNVALYGSMLSGALEAASGTTGKPLTPETPDLESAAWVTLEVAAPEAYRTYYVSRSTGDFYGNVAECELYGWTRADEGSETPLGFTVIRADLATYYPSLSWNDISERGVAVQRADGPEGPWTTLTTVASGEAAAYVDATARYGLPYYYRLSYDGKTSDVQMFRRLRRLDTAAATLFTNSAGADWSAVLGPENAFDGDLKNRAEQPQIPDWINPKIGVDFGKADVVVALARFYPRNEWDGNTDLSAGAVLYGSLLSAGEESATTALGTKLTDATDFPKHRVEWQERTVASPDFHRTYYYQGNYNGNMAEVELYGWLRSDVQHPTRIIFR